jgi:hypothetical protein
VKSLKNLATLTKNYLHVFHLSCTKEALMSEGCFVKSMPVNNTEKCSCLIIILCERNTTTRLTFVCVILVWFVALSTVAAK